VVGHRFDSPGEFVGVVTVGHPDTGLYTGVFPFEAGYTGLGYWPWVIAGLLMLQLNYLWMSGRFNQFRKRKSPTRAHEAGMQHA
jgi:hypothetical protein